MKNISAFELSVIHDRVNGTISEIKTSPYEKERSSPELEDLIKEGGEDFHRYLTWTGLIKEPNIMILSPLKHYYYGHDDLLGISTLVNLKALNNVKHPESFLHSLFRLLPPGTSFVGCFVPPKDKRSFRHTSKFMDGLKNIFDSRVGSYYSRQSVTGLLLKHGFEIIDITDIEGISYFWAKNLRKQGECN